MCVRVLCLLAALSASAVCSPRPATPQEITKAERWRDIITEYVKEAASRTSNSPSSFTVDLPNEGGRPIQLPVLVVPVPVPSNNVEGCQANAGRVPPPPIPAPEEYKFSSNFASETENIDFDAPKPQVTSEQLLAEFLAQRPLAPHLPPAVITPPPRVLSSAAAGVPPPGNTYLPPSPPRFPSSLYMHALLTVPHADYSEPYQVWYDENSGASRVQFHQEGTTTFRLPQAGGSMQHLEIRQDRTGEAELVVCSTGSPSPQAASPAGIPGLPDLQLFSFAEYVVEDGVSAEKWTYEVQGRAGEQGGARGEALRYRHELLLARQGEFTMPIRYKVSVDSSILGPDTDQYEHRYFEVRPEEHAPDTFQVNMERTCDSIEQLDMRSPEQLARLEPLREFTLPVRDPRHDDGIANFKKEFGRKYIDDTEEAIRKNLYVQHNRFVCSCNREGATFETEVNFLGDRLDAELEILLGTLDDGSDGGDAPFPHGDARAEAAALPDEFDWRPEGAVTPVRYQGSCSSCWAFAVVGSVEGAVFLHSGQLVPLAEQCLVDCAHSHGAHGCRGTWPSHAYEYVKDRGLPSQTEYTPYTEKVLKCRDREIPPVTHINGYVNVPPNNTDALKVAIRKHAPTVVVVDARPKSFMFYKKGVLMDERCLKGPNKKLNHAVLAVGWGEQRGEPHFILKNTYSARWGDGGYIRLHAPSNTCGHLSIPSYARLARPDIDRLPNPQPDALYKDVEKDG